MGDNERRLVKGYLELSEALKVAKEQNDHHKAEIINAKMEGIIFGYETYVSEHWNTFTYLLKRYADYTRQ